MAQVADLFRYYADKRYEIVNKLHGFGKELDVDARDFADSVIETRYDSIKLKDVYKKYKIEKTTSEKFVERCKKIVGNYTNDWFGYI